LKLGQKEGDWFPKTGGKEHQWGAALVIWNQKEPWVKGERKKDYSCFKNGIGRGTINTRPKLTPKAIRRKLEKGG